MELTKKMYRDIRENFLQFFSIFLIAALGVFAFSGLNSVRKGLTVSMDRYYEQTNIADLWIYAANPDDEKINSISELQNVKCVQSRLEANYYYDNKELTIISSDKNELSKPYIVEGSNYDLSAEGIWIDRDFADANDYHVGDIIPINGVDVTIEGIILSSEKIYSPPSGEVITDFKIYGYAYMPKNYYAKLFGIYYTNQLLLKLDDNSSQKIKDVVSETSEILGESFYTYIKKDDLASITHINERKKQLMQFTFIFPMLFYILALLTMLTTMKRIIDKQKIQIATMMSLGYSRMQIIFHYMSYGIWIGLFGGIAGAFVGYYVIPDTLIESFKHLAMVPYWDAPFTFESLIAVLLMTAVCVIAIILSCYKQIRIMPALIFHGDGIRKTKHNLLEKTALWDKMSFKVQMTIRNITRNKVRTLMGIIGVFGSVILVLVGLGMKDSFDYTVSATYNDFYSYQSKIQLSEYNEDIDLDDDYQLIDEENIEIKNTEKDEFTKVQAQITIIDKGKYLSAPVGSTYINLSETNGITISKKIAETLGVKEKEKLDIKFNGGTWKQLKIDRVVDSALPRVLYVSRSAWEESNEQFVPNAILTSVEKDKINPDTPGFKKVVSIESQEASFQKVCDSSKSIVYIMIFAAVILVVVVLINLGIMNFTEMYRDYATLKVLGLFPKEIAYMSFAENLVLTMIGWITGIYAAYQFVDVYMDILSNDTLVCLSKIQNISVLIASLIIICCSFSVNILLSSKLRNVNMVEALKANE